MPGAQPSRSPAVFLDRDGTLIEDVGYVDRLDRLRLYPWSVEAVRLLRRAGYAAVVVTNQAGVARGMISEQVVVEVRDRLQQDLARAGARLDGHYHCPHLPDAPLAAYRRRCGCHKPEPGMIRQAAAELALDLDRSVVVGDRWTDVRLARRRRHRRDSRQDRLRRQPGRPPRPGRDGGRRRREPAGGRRLDSPAPAASAPRLTRRRAAPPARRDPCVTIRFRAWLFATSRVIVRSCS